jgi:hypothetical protein
MFNWIRRRRLSPDTRKRLLLIAARAEEAIVETHVANLLDMIEILEDEVDLDRAMELYVEMMSLDETRASTVTNRLLASLESPGMRTGRRGQRYKNVFRERP